MPSDTPAPPTTPTTERDAERAGQLAYWSDGEQSPPASWSWLMQRAWRRGWQDAMSLKWRLA